NGTYQITAVTATSFSYALAFPGKIVANDSGSAVGLSNVLTQTGGSSITMFGGTGNDSLSSVGGSSITLVGGMGNDSLSTTNGTGVLLQSGTGTGQMLTQT